MYAAAHDTIDDQLVRYRELQNVVNGDAGFFHGVSLRDSAREAVQQETVTAIFLGDTLFHQRDDQLIGHQFAGVHDVFRLFTELGAGFYRGAQHIAGGDLRNTVFLHDELSLSSFTRARSAKQNNTHYENPLKCRFNFSKNAKPYHQNGHGSRKAVRLKRLMVRYFMQSNVKCPV